MGADQLRLQRSADLLLLALTPAERGVIPGKLFEYMSVRLPVLAVGCPDGEAAKLIRSTGCGFVADDYLQLKRQLEDWLTVKRRTGEIPDGPPPPEESTRREQTRRLSRFLERVVDMTRSRRGRLLAETSQEALSSRERA